MPDWPQAPRLEASLDELAQHASTDGPAKSETAQLLALAERDHTTPLIQLDTDRGHLRRNTRLVRSAVLVAAIGLIAAGLYVASVVADLVGDDEAPASELIEEHREVETRQPLAPLLAASDLCLANENGDELARTVRLGSNPVEVGVWASPPIALEAKTVIVIGTGTNWRTVANRAAIRGAHNSTAIIYVATDDITTDEFWQLTETIASSVCEAGPLYLISLDAALGPDLVCRQQGAVAFSGYTFSNPGHPPNDCVISRPTLVVEDPGSPGHQHLWAEHLGCEGPTMSRDEWANITTEWQRCKTTLLHVRSSASPWTDRIGEAPVAEVVFAAMALAN